MSLGKLSVSSNSYKYPWLKDCMGIFPQVFLSRNDLAILLVDKGGVGLESFLLPIVQEKYCKEDKKPCEKCAPCRQIETGIFTKVRFVTGEEGKVAIECIRELSAWLAQKSGQPLTVVIPHADRMTQQAQNALLKILEDPSQVTTYVLTTERVESLLPTIRSRLIAVRVKTPKEKESLSYLIQKGFDLQDAKNALHLCEGRVLTAEQFLQEDKNLWQGLCAWLETGNCTDKWMTEALQKSNLEKILAWWIQYIEHRLFDVNSILAWDFVDRLVECYQLVQSGVAVNGKLLLLALQIEWKRSLQNE